MFLPCIMFVLYQMAYSRYGLLYYITSSLLWILHNDFYLTLDLISWAPFPAWNGLVLPLLQNPVVLTSGHSTYWCWTWCCPQLSTACYNSKLLASNSPPAALVFQGAGTKFYTMIVFCGVVSKLWSELSNVFIVNIQLAMDWRFEPEKGLWTLL